MDTYNAKSCSALAKLHYKPIDAALRWCGLIDHETKILQATGEAQYPPLGSFPQWPCLRSNIERIIDAIENGDIPCGRDGKTVTLGDHVAIARRTIRHNDLRAWLEKYYPDQKPAFLFDEVERTTHAAINADSFRALQADRDALKARIEKAEEWSKKIIAEKNDLILQVNNLTAQVGKDDPVDIRERTSYLNIIGAMLAQLTAGRANGTTVITQAITDYGTKQGISERKLQETFAAAKRSLGAS